MCGTHFKLWIITRFMDLWARSWETHFQLTEDKEPSLSCGSFCLELIQAGFIRTFQQESKKETVKIENDQSFESSYHKWYSFTLSYFVLLKASQWIPPTQWPCRESWMSLRIIWGAVCSSDVHLRWFGETCSANHSILRVTSLCQGWWWTTISALRSN